MPWVALTFAAACLLAAGPLSAQSVGIALAPTVQRVQWHDDLALANDWMYGGRLALRFGPWLELQPFYFVRNASRVDSARAVLKLGPAALGRTLDLQHYGTSLQLNLSRGAAVPFVRGGAGVLRFEPDSGERRDRIAVSVGAGLRFGAGGVNAEVFADQLGFRLNPRTLFGTDTLGAPVPTLRNLVYGAAVTIPIATGRDESEDIGLVGSTAPIEPFVGRLRYAGAFGLADQELIGVRAGIDLSPIAGLRGFYWRGANDDRDGPAPVSGYGGEAQFNLNTGPGVSPYLVIGAGKLDFGRDFRDSLGVPRVDRTALILGGGLSVRVSDRLRLNGSIRDYLMTIDDPLGEIASTSDLTHSTLLSAGLTISLGGRSASDAAERRRTRERDVREREVRERELRARGLRDDDLRERELTDRARMDRERQRRSDRDSVMLPPGMMPGIAREGRWITVPVPTVGEVILRYGLPVGRERDTVGAIVRRDTMLVSGTPDDISDRLADLERRLAARLEAMQALLLAQRAVDAPTVAPPTVTVLTPRGEVVPLTVDRAETPLLRRLGTMGSRDLQPYAGLGLDDGDVQVIVGLRADLGPLNAGSAFRFVPELAVGVGEGPLSVLALANVRYTFGGVGGSETLVPYVTLGGGIHSPTVLGINTAVGSSLPLRRGEATTKPLYLHIELQGLNLFQQTRVLFALSRNRGLR